VQPSVAWPIKNRQLFEFGIAETFHRRDDKAVVIDDNPHYERSVQEF
jgi:hypothetical protein